MKYIFYIGIIIILLISLGIFFKDSDDAILSQSDNIQARFGEHIVELEVVDTIETRTQGLSGRESLTEGTGMLFVFDEPGTHGIWMKDMNFAIDVLWLNENFQIIYMVEGMTPESFPNVYRSRKPAKYVVEFPANFVSENNVMIHDQMTPISL